MAALSFSVAFNRTMNNEGGWVLHTVKHDRGGMTFAGIARKYNSSWSGWQLIDAGDRGSDKLKAMVKAFYYRNYFHAAGLLGVKSQLVVNVIYDFAVNAGVRTAVRIAQQSLGCNADGIAGPKTISALNDIEEDEFVCRYALVKIKRYSAIVNSDRSQSKFLLGWINRTMRDLETL